MRCKMADPNNDPEKDKKIEVSKTTPENDPAKEEKSLLKDYLAKAGSISPGIAALGLECGSKNLLEAEQAQQEQAQHGYLGNHPSLERGTLEDVPETRSGDSLRKIVVQGTDAVDALRKTRDYMFAREALENSGRFIQKDENLFAKDSFEKAFAFENPFSRINDNRANARALELDYTPENGEAVRLGIRSLRVFTGAGESQARDVLLQRRMAYELAVSDYEAGLSNRLAKTCKGLFSEGEPTEAEPEGTSKIVDFGIPEFKKSPCQRREDPGYDPKAGKGKKPDSE